LFAATNGTILTTAESRPELRPRSCCGTCTLALPRPHPHQILEKTTMATSSVVAIYDTHELAEQAIKRLQESGIDMKALSIVGKDTHTEEQVTGYYNAGDRMKRWGKIGAFWGGFWGLLFGSALFVIPGLGPIMVAGPLASWMVAGLEGAVTVGGLGAIGAGLMSIGIPHDSVLNYETAIKTDKFLLLVHGDVVEVAKAKDVIQQTAPASCHAHV